MIMRGHKITRESGRKLSKLLRRERLQPPLERDTNTRPVGATGKGGGIRMYDYEVTAVTTNLTFFTATIRELNSTTTVATGVTVRDHHELMRDHDVGDKGICFKQDDVYYALVAPCVTPSNV